jgi:hypothetical protein
MSLTYGYDLKDGDKILEALVQLSEIMSPLVLPGGALVNHPFLCAFNFILCHASSASWLFSVRHSFMGPILQLQTIGAKVRNLSVRIRNEPIDFVKNALVCVVVMLRAFTLNDTTNAIA